MTTYQHLPTLTQLRHLKAVAEHRHFGKAAAACFISQPSLSASIKELETILGSTLIERTRRSVMMTALGDQVVEKVGKILTDVEEVTALVRAKEEPLSGRLRMGVIPTIAPFLLPRVLPALRRAYPKLQLYLTEDKSAVLTDRLGSGDLDLALLAFPYPTDKFQTHVFADDPFWVAFPRDTPFSEKERLSANDIKKQAFLFLGEGHCLREHAIKATRGSHIEAFGQASLHTLVQMVDNGLGITLLPKMAIDAGVTKGTRIAVRPLEGQAALRHIGFAWRSSCPTKDDFVLLANFFRDELATPLSPGRKKTV